jgi:hypothetical protein
MKLTKKQIDLIIEYTKKELKGKSTSIFKTLVVTVFGEIK